MKIFTNFLLITLFLTGCENSEEKLARRADKIHSSILTVDTHCDTPMEFSDPAFDLGKRHDEGCVDFPRMIEGGLHAEFFVVFTAQGPRNDSSYSKVHQQVLDTVSYTHLRAHETVLDLVCRLLLEKKKT